MTRAGTQAAAHEAKGSGAFLQRKPERPSEEPAACDGIPLFLGLRDASTTATHNDASALRRRDHDLHSGASTESRNDTATPRYLRPSSRAPQIQRQEESGSASTSGLQLTPPSLLTPPDPYARFRPHFDLQLRLDPDIQARIRALLASELDPAQVLPSAQAAVNTVGGAPAVPTVPGATGATGTPATSAARTATPPSGPGASAARSESQPRAGSPGDLLSAVVATQPVTRLLDTMKERALGDLDRYWSSASTGERFGFVTSSVIVGGGIIAPLLGFREPREFVLPLLNDKVIPIPGLPGYGLEFRFGERDVMVGAHLDVGRLLPQSWGFGPASLSPIGGPPASATPPVTRKADEGASHADAPDTVARIESRRGQGHPVPHAVRMHVSRHVADDLSRARIHDDTHADRLSRDLHARAFTSGSDIFFRSGRYDPASPQGQKLIAHELTHVAQQARGEVQGKRRANGLSIGAEDDRHEIEADRVADDVVRNAATDR